MKVDRFYEALKLKVTAITPLPNPFIQFFFVAKAVPFHVSSSSLYNQDTELMS